MKTGRHVSATFTTVQSLFDSWFGSMAKLARDGDASRSLDQARNMLESTPNRAQNMLANVLRGDVLLALGIILILAFMLVPMMFVFPHDIIVAYLLFVTIHATWCHCNFGPTMRWLEPWLIQPRYHHWHHARHVDYMDVNYAIHLPLVDMLMGTFRRPPADAWPEEYGGRGASLLQWLIFEEEYYAADAPGRVSQNGINLLAPTLFEHGTPEQRARVQLSPNGLHWEEIAQEISVAGLLAAVGEPKAKD